MDPDFEDYQDRLSPGKNQRLSLNEPVNYSASDLTK
jgi:hypothetical protein